MKSEYINQFIGKICTVLTRPLNRDFKQENPETYPEQIFHYFMGRVIGVDDHGMLMEQITTPERLKSYFFFHSVVAIAEEQILNPVNPIHAQEINDIKTANESMRQEIDKIKQSPPQKPIVLGEVNADGQFINPQNMSNLSDEMEEKFGK